MKHHFSIILILTLVCSPLEAGRHDRIQAGRPSCEIVPSPPVPLKYEVRLPEFYHRRDTVEVTIVGDVMMHKRQLEYDCRTFLEEIRPALERPEITIAGAEFTLGGQPYAGYPQFSAPDEYAEYLRDCGVDVLLTANNHILDRGSKGFARTLGIYRSMSGMKFTGSGADKAEFDSLNPLILKTKNFTLAMLNFTYGTNLGGQSEYPRAARLKREEILPMIERAKAAGADFIIALPHWGDEYVLTHNSLQEEWARWLVSRGVDAIVGAHPHVVQDSCTIDGCPVFYSLGNLVSNMSAPNTQVGLVVTLRFEYDWLSGEKRQLPPLTRRTWCSLPGTRTPSYSTYFLD